MEDAFIIRCLANKMGHENNIDMVRVRCIGIKHCSSAYLMIGFFQLEEGKNSYCGQLCDNASSMPSASQKGYRKLKVAREGKNNQAKIENSFVPS